MNDYAPPRDCLICADVFVTRAWLKLCQARLTVNAQDAPTRMPVLSVSDLGSSAYAVVPFNIQFKSAVQTDSVGIQLTGVNVPITPRVP